MKNVLVLLHDDEGQEARLQVALDVARALDGHLTCLDVLVPVVVPDFTGLTEAALFDVAYEQESRNRTQVTKRLEAEDVPFSMLEAVGNPGDELSKAADFADIVVATSHRGETSPLDAKHTIAEVVTETDRPVFAVPPACRGINLRGKALVAWNGTVEANEALRSALPLLRLASSVTLLDLNAREGGYEANEAASYLSRHGIHTRVVLQDTRSHVSDAILDKASNMEAAYIVMGAYGPGQTLETIFGGVTNSMLNNSEVPLLLAH